MNLNFSIKQLEQYELYLHSPFYLVFIIIIIIIIINYF